MGSIVLIGMPGSGKTTIGRKLAKKLNLDFIDTDNEIEKRERLCINEIFKIKGEEYFRACEKDVLKTVIKKNAVISTGGGIILDVDNIRIIKENANKIIFINRDLKDILEDITISTRPLIKDDINSIYKLYEERYDKYLTLCDIKIENNSDIEAVIRNITDKLKGEK